MRNLLKTSAVIVGLFATVLLSACGGGSGGGNNVGQTYYATCVDGTQRSSKVSASDAVAQCPGVVYTATCADNTQRTSTVSVSDALVKCPGTAFSAICTDLTAKTSTTSQAAANALCPIGVVTTVSAPSYKDEKLDALNQLNADRAQCGFGKLQQNAKLDVAAQGHADWLAANPFHATTHVQDPSTGKGTVTGVQGDDRIQNAGYVPSPWVDYLGTYSMGEVIGVPSWGNIWTCPNCINNASYGNTELSARNGVRQLYSSIYHLVGILAFDRDVGFGVATGDRSASYGTGFTKNVVIDSGTVAGWVRQSIPAESVLTFPCQGIAVTPVFRGENPEPFPRRGSTTEYGQPVYVMGAEGTTLTINPTTSSITPAGGVPVATTIFSTTVDPLGPNDGRNIKSHQIFLVPTQRLLDNTTYTVIINGTNTGMVSNANPTGAFYRTFTFNTLTNTTL